MHGSITKWLAHALATAVVLGLPAIGLGQELQSATGSDAGYPAVAATQDSPSIQFASSSSADQSDLGARVAKLEDALKKAEADKKKAAQHTAVVGGMLQWDVQGFQRNDVSRYGQGGTWIDGEGARRARLMVTGELYDVVEYKCEYDFAKSSTTNFKDVFVNIKELPVVGNFKIGHFKEPFGLEQLTSDRFTTFAERSLSDENAIVPARNPGMQFMNTYDEQNGTWAIGWFAQNASDGPPTFQTNGCGTALTMRATYLPWYDECTNGRGLLHLGAAYSYRSVNNDAGSTNANLVTVSAKPEANLAPTVIGWSLGLPGVVAVDEQLFGAEAALVYGPFSAQSEVFNEEVHQTMTGRGVAQPDISFNGMYAQVSWFLTGENRAYSRTNGSFDRVAPFENFFRVRGEDGCCYTGKGAWEVAYRYSYLDLMSGVALSGVSGAGRGGEHTIGLNWYLNPYTRVIWDYAFANIDVNNGANNLITGGQVQIATMRCAIDF